MSVNQTKRSFILSLPVLCLVGSYRSSSFSAFRPWIDITLSNEYRQVQKLPYSKRDGMVHMTFPPSLQHTDFEAISPHGRLPTGPHKMNSSTISVRYRCRSINADIVP